MIFRCAARRQGVALAIGCNQDDVKGGVSSAHPGAHQYINPHPRSLINPPLNPTDYN